MKILRFLPIALTIATSPCLRAGELAWPPVLPDGKAVTTLGSEIWLKPPGELKEGEGL